MKTAICYASKSGTTKECAELLKKEFGGDNPQRKFNEYIELAQKGYLDKEDIQELRKTLHKQCGILVSPHICYN